MPLNDFIILNKVGSGSYSEVWKVRRISDRNIYALKKVRITTLKEKQKLNALNQVRLLASINSQHIIGYKQAFFDEKSNTLCIIMQFADGGDLEKIIQLRKKSLQLIPQRIIWKIIHQMVNGLSVLHDKKIIHRDLKSANIFLSGKVYKLADLNVSKLLKSKMAYTQTGTPYYASPEVWQDKPYELKSDIWSLGCIIYQLCALKPPFTANNMNILYKKVLKGVYSRIPGVYSSTLQHLIGRCLQVDVNKRINCLQLFKLLEQNNIKTQNYQDDTGQINLLNTIKVPKSLQSWRDDLPKSNYNRETGITSFNQQYPLNGYRHSIINRNKLLEIAHCKEQGTIKKKNITVANPENKKQSKVKLQKVQILPKIKLKSQPNSNLNVVINRIRQNDHARYAYHRPQWWG